MKVLFYIDTMRRGGAQRVMSNLVNYFASKTNKIILINDARIDKNIPVYEISENVDRYYLRDSFVGNPIKKNIDRVCVLRSIIKKEKPDIVLSFLGNCNKRMLLATIGINCKKIVSVRNDPKHEYGDKWIKRAIARQIFKLADGCVFQTCEAKEYFPIKVQKKSAIIYNPVDQQFFDTKRQENTKHIVTFGRLEKQKNHKLLIDAYEKVYTKFADDLYIYGSGPLREELQSYVVEKGLKDRVFFPGNISNVAEILSGAKIFVLTSDYEGMPNALMEAMTVGVPVISTDCPCGGPKILIRNENEGILVPVKDVDALSVAIRTVLSYEEIQKKMTVEEQRRAKDFKIAVIMNEWDKYLKRVQGL